MKTCPLFFYSSVIQTIVRYMIAGICDPYDSEECRSINDWDFCEQAEFECDQLNEDGKHDAPKNL
jgi:hypothetical protein